MNPATLRDLLEGVRAGQTTIDEALRDLASLPFQHTEAACVDHHRALRCGFPEVIFGQGKTPQQVAEIFGLLVAHGGNVLATRVAGNAARLVREHHPEAVYHETARALTLRQTPPSGSAAGFVAVVCAGTSDLPVAEEARVTLEIMDQPVKLIADVGVAGLHRLLACAETLQAANAVVVVAGMEGALPSVVGGLIAAPVIAVPTSIGYGASFQGLAALLAMLNSCASGVSVVNIDNGFGAAYQAALINRRAGQAGGAADSATPGNMRACDG